MEDRTLRKIENIIGDRATLRILPLVVDVDLPMRLILASVVSSQICIERWKYDDGIYNNKG